MELNFPTETVIIIMNYWISQRGNNSLKALCRKCGPKTIFFFFFFLKRDGKWITRTRTIYQCLRIVPSGNSFLALNRNHQFLFKKSRNLMGQFEHNGSNLIALHCWKILRLYKVIKFESLCSSCPIKFWLF